MKPPLHRLPNGAHVDLAKIGPIVPTRRKDGPSVQIWCGAEALWCDFPTFSAAQAYADELATLVNKARAGPPDAAPMTSPFSDWTDAERARGFKIGYPSQFAPCDTIYTSGPGFGGPIGIDLGN